jgi:hypothetical protein
MTLDQAIARLESLREEYGGDMPLAIEKESTQSGRVNLFEPARIEVYQVVEVSSGKQKHWVSLTDGNTHRIAVVW